MSEFFGIAGMFAATVVLFLVMLWCFKRQDRTESSIVGTAYSFFGMMAGSVCMTTWVMFIAYFLR